MGLQGENEGQLSSPPIILYDVHVHVHVHVLTWQTDMG